MTTRALSHKIHIDFNIIHTEDGAWQHEEIVLKPLNPLNPLNPAYADIVIPNAEAEEFMVVAEVVGKSW